MFQIDWSKIIYWLIPTFLREKIHFSWINAMLAPLKRLHISFLRWKNEQEYLLHVNGQVIYLERFLKDKYFDDIKVTDRGYKEKIYIFQKVVDKPIYLGSKHIFLKSEYKNEHVDVYVDFYVDIPDETYSLLSKDDFNKITASVNVYKVVGRIFKIRNVNTLEIYENN